MSNGNTNELVFKGLRSLNGILDPLMFCKPRTQALNTFHTPCVYSMLKRRSLVVSTFSFAWLTPNDTAESYYKISIA